MKRQAALADPDYYDPYWESREEQYEKVTPAVYAIAKNLGLLPKGLYKADDYATYKRKTFPGTGPKAPSSTMAATPSRLTINFNNQAGKGNRAGVAASTTDKGTTSYTPAQLYYNDNIAGPENAYMKRARERRAKRVGRNLSGSGVSSYTSTGAQSYPTTKSIY
jgi:hypothetical protein